MPRPAVGPSVRARTRTRWRFRLGSGAGPWTRLALAVVLVALLWPTWLATPTTALAAGLPSGFSETIVASGLASPTAMALAPDGRIFVAEQGGALRVIKNGTLLTTPFLTVTVNAAGERGLLGVAFDPNFAGNGFVYVYYTATTPTLHNRVSRFTASGDVAAAGSETIILELDNLSSATNHNGGALHFGLDGKLYVAVGENANGQNAQTLNNLLGKLLRINADGTIPTDNPFYTSATGRNRAIWALGLRNPFSFDIQPGSGRLFINDVGENTWEEINDGVAGSNYGWPTTEGETNDTRFRSPVYVYGHGTGSTSGCAITGGAFYNPTTGQFPADYVGDYFFADYCSGWIRRYDPGTDTATGFATGLSSPVDLKTAPDGSLYYLARGGGVLGRIRYTATQAPTITQHPASQTVAVGQPATFSVTAGGTPPLSYQWQRNGANIAGATAASYTLASATLADNGAQFRCIVSNAAGSATSNSATLTVTSNRAPTGTITTPAEGTLYIAGQTISYSGTGADPEDGTLPASAFTWRVDFHHDNHTHPHVQPTSGVTSGSFLIPDSGETSANVWYRIHLTVRDSAGLTHSSFRDVLPRKATITLATSPGGLQVTLDGQPQTAPHSLASVVGMKRTIGAPSPQTLGDSTYDVVGWSDGGAATHEIVTPPTDTTYTATFRARSGTGLAVTYYNNRNFNGRKVSRTDATVDFDWGTGSPAPSIDPDTFSARWTGQVQPRDSGTYTFYTLSNDGVRLWVNGQLLIDNWTNHAVTENSGTITLTAGQKYDIRMEYYDDTGAAVAQLLWSSPATSKQVIPQSQLYPTTGS